MKVYNIHDIIKLDADTAVTVGMFDGVHVGHRQMVRHLGECAMKRGLKPIVVTFRNHPRRVLQRSVNMPLLTTFEERMELMERCGVERVVAMEFDEHTAHLSACDFARQILVGHLNMKMLFLGYDNKFGSSDRDDFAMLPELGKELGFDIVRDEPVMVDGVEVSSTKIRKALLEGSVERANRMLGDAYSVRGVVVHGRHVGSEIGFPTANIDVTDRGKLLPADGVYALRAWIGGESYAAVGNFGARPTFAEARKTIEVHIIGYSGNLYGTTLRVDVLRHLRAIRRFDSRDELVQQIKKDIGNVQISYELTPTGTWAYPEK